MVTKVRGDDNFDTGKLIGKGGTPEDVTSQIVSGQPRANNKGRPITVYITIGTGQNADIFLDGFLVFPYTSIGS